MTDTTIAERRSFDADVARLLHMMVHSVYSDRDVALRELVANGADACEKLRTLALSNQSLYGDDPQLGVTVRIDPDASRLIVEDNGIGMTRDEMIDALGTIARSGTRHFLDANAETEAAKNLIGQFGVGFYAAFMIADHVDVTSRKAGTQEAFTWSSDGKGEFTVEPAGENAPVRGTRVSLHINADAKNFLDPFHVSHVLRNYASAIPVAVTLIPKPDAEPEKIADGAVIWAKSKSELGEEDYTSFYRSLAFGFDDPALTLHWRAEGRHEYTVLAFVPGARPMNLFNPDRQGRMKLYVRRMFIADDVALTPGWLRFVTGIVDSADLPLNLSREMIQTSPILAAIKNGVTNRVLSELEKTAQNDAPKYKGIWDNFGPVLKEGLYEAPEKRDQLFELCRFATSTHPEGDRTLKDYIAALRPNQTAIYFLVGDDLERLKKSPHLEGFRARGIEVLLLPDPVDAFWVNTAVGYEGKPFKSVTQGAADIDGVPLAEGEAASTEVDAQTATLFAHFKDVLASEAADVRGSTRLASSLACLVASTSGPDRRLEKILASHGQLPEAAKPVLEINPGHPLVAQLAKRFVANEDRPLIDDAAHIIFDTARASDGEAPKDPSDFAARLGRIMEKAFS